LVCPGARKKKDQISRREEKKKERKVHEHYLSFKRTKRGKEDGPSLKKIGRTKKARGT